MPAVAKKKYDKDPKIDFGSRRDWIMRLKNTLVLHKTEGYFFVQDVNEEVKPACPKVAKKLSEQIERADTDTEKRRLRRLYDKHIRENRKVSMSLFGYICPEKKSPSNSFSVSAEEISYKIFNIGFVNWRMLAAKKHEAIFVSRLAAGGLYRQGLQSSNIVKTAASSGERLGNRDGASVTSCDFIKALNNNYPTVREALEMCFSYENTSACAFDSNYAVKVDDIGHITLIHRTRTVGTSYDEGESFNLVGRFKYLKEELIQLGVKIND